MKNITEAEKRKIIGLILALIPNTKIYLCGSRARGTHSKYSDIDLALDTGEKLDFVALDEAKSIMAATNLIYRFDIGDMNRMAEDSRAVVLQEGML